MTIEEWACKCWDQIIPSFRDWDGTNPNDGVDKTMVILRAFADEVVEKCRQKGQRCTITGAGTSRKFIDLGLFNRAMDAVKEEMGWKEEVKHDER